MNSAPGNRLVRASLLFERRTDTIQHLQVTTTHGRDMKLQVLGTVYVDDGNEECTWYVWRTKSKGASGLLVCTKAGHELCRQEQIGMSVWQLLRSAIRDISSRSCCYILDGRKIQLKGYGLGKYQQWILGTKGFYVECVDRFAKVVRKCETWKYEVDCKKGNGECETMETNLLPLIVMWMCEDISRYESGEVGV